MSSDQRTLPAMAIQLGELLTNTKGGKSLPLRREGSSEPVVWQSAEVQKILWQPSAYNDADAKRVPICLEPEETAAQELEEIEKQVVQLLSQQSQSDTKMFGKALAPHEVEARLQSCRKTSARGNSFLKYWDRVRVWGRQRPGAAGVRGPGRPELQGEGRDAPVLAHAAQLGHPHGGHGPDAHGSPDPVSVLT